jgi:hypothetical protein
MTHHTYSPGRGSSPTIWREKKVSEQEFRHLITTIKLALIPKLTITTMEMFSSLDEFWATSEPKSGGAS